MKEYYYLDGKTQNGPFAIEQLLDKKLTNETLIWVEGMDNWQKLKDIPELIQIIRPKAVPPPPPNDTNKKISKTEVSGQLKVTTEKIPNPTLEAIKPNKTTLTWLIIWCSIHLFALLMSYSRIEFFNRHKPETEQFWPFCDFYRYYYGKEFFQGVFTNYDWSEFAFYVGGAIIIFLLVRISNKKDETVSKV